jgi:uncharacterized membrane protein
MAWEYLKFFHLLFAFIMMGGMFISQYAIIQARRTDEPGLFGIYLRMSKVGGSMAGGGLLVVSLLGGLTAWQQNIPMSTGWLSAAYATAIVAFIIPPLTFARWEKQAAALMPDAEAQGEVLAAQKQLIAGPRFRVVNSIITALLVWMLMLMVFKPF